jgi:hypothetical protein
MRKNFIVLVLIVTFSACQKKAAVPAAPNTNINPITINSIAPTPNYDSINVALTQHYKGSLSLVEPVVYNSVYVYTNTIFSVHDIGADSFVIATADYLPFNEFGSGPFGDSIIYGFKKNDQRNYFSYHVSVKFIGDSLLVHMSSKDGCDEGSTVDFAGKRQ